ncbi:unnamed protein product [Coccothraustes coccothraustes]
MSWDRRVPALRHFPIAPSPAGAAGLGTARTVRRARAAALPGGGAVAAHASLRLHGGIVLVPRLPDMESRGTGAGTGLSRGRGVPALHVSRSPLHQKVEASQSRRRPPAGNFPSSQHPASVRDAPGSAPAPAASAERPPSPWGPRRKGAAQSCWAAVTK